jgi:radical SAM protein with 4Fe4S-binding SPASM domain
MTRTPMNSPTNDRRQKIIVFEATQRCNLSCRFCYNTWHKHPEARHGDLGSRETREMLAKLLKEAKPSLCTISGGEPTLRPDLVDTSLQAALSGATVYLITNGQLLDKKLAKMLVRAGINTFEIQLLSDRADEHEYLQGTKGSFEKSVRGIEAVLTTKGRMVVALIVTKINLARLWETLEFSQKLGAHGVMLNRFNPGGRGLENLQELSLAPIEVLMMLDVAERYAVERRFPISVSIPIPCCLVDTKNYPHLGFGFCSAGTEECYPVVDSIGNLRPCNHTPLVLGNIREKGFWELMDSQVRRDFIDQIPEICQGCKDLETCRASCRAAALECGGKEPFVAQVLATSRARA